MTINAPITLPAPVVINAPLTFGYLTGAGGGEGAAIDYADGFASTVTSDGETIQWPAAIKPSTP